MSAASPANAGIRRRGPFIFRLLRVLLVIILLLLVAAAGFVYYSIQKAMPTISGTLKVGGLSANAIIVRDKEGIPHLTAANPSDLFFANGYAHAQDRLFQMELFRRNASGRLAEFAGERALSRDRLMRAVGLRRVAEEEYKTLTPEQREPLDRYAAGVNAFIEGHKDSLPVEFTLAGISPEPWTAVDSLAIGRQIPWTLSGNWSTELTIADIAAKLDTTRALDLFPDVDASFNTISGGSGSGLRLSDQQAAASVGNPNGSLADYKQSIALFPLRMKMEGLGSNNWVVDGSKSSTGKPLLANDPHLGVQNPAIWTQLHLQTTDGSFNVVGFSFAGIPGVVIGHNDRIAWGVTNVGPDTQDLYIERTDAAHPGQYQFQDDWEDFRLVTETIKIKGAAADNYVVRISRHGPIISDALKGVSSTLALKWVANDPVGLLPAVIELDQARDWPSFRTALSKWTLAGQNFVYADVDGNIGYQATGKVPVRAQGNGLLPVPGWTGENEWTGFVNFDQMPSIYNPPSHYIATANNRPAAGPFLAARYAPPYRIGRIRQLLEAKDKLSVADMTAIQYDSTSLLAAKIAPYLAALKSSDPAVQQAIDRFKSWDGNMAADSVTAAIYAQTFNRVLTDTFADELGSVADEYLDQEGDASIKLEQMLDRTADLWWDDVKTAGKQEQRDDILLKAITTAVGELNGKQGSDQAKWQWGKLHKLYLDHPLGGVKVLGIQIFGSFNHGPYELSGDNTTVNVSHYSVGDALDGQGYDETAYPSMRKVEDVSDWAGSRWILPGGASGQPFSKHFGDQVDGYMGGKYNPIRFSDAAIKDGAEGTLTLTP